MPELKQYSFKELKSIENSRAVFVINDKVYNVTKFLEEHPGGEEILLDHHGEEATEDFNDVGHSVDALELMSKYLIGEIVPSERRNKEIKHGWKTDAAHKGASEQQVGGPGSPFFLFAGAVALVAFVYFYFL